MVSTFIRGLSSQFYSNVTFVCSLSCVEVVFGVGRFNIRKGGV